MSDFLQRHGAAIASLRVCFNRLQRIAKAFDTTGNTQMAMDLTEIGMAVLHGADEAETAVRKNIHDEFDQHQQNSAKLLDALLGRSEPGA